MKLNMHELQNESSSARTNLLYARFFRLLLFSYKKYQKKEDFTELNPWYKQPVGQSIYVTLANCC